MAKIAGFFVTKNTVFQMTIDTQPNFFIFKLHSINIDYWKQGG